MTRLSAAFWLGLVLVSGFATFRVKYTVQDIDDQLARVHKQDTAEHQEIRVLNAEWTYLNQPERLAEMNQRFLQLVPISAKQLQQKIEDIPLRPPPVPEPDVVAANPAPPTQAAATVTVTPQPAARLPVTPAVLAQAHAPAPTPAPIASGQNRPPVRIATADAAAAPSSLDALFAQVAEKQ